MKTELKSVNTRLSVIATTLTLLLSLTGCATITDIVPQLPIPQTSNSSLPIGQDIAQANALLNAGRKREAADAYFKASQNYRSPKQERLRLQAAELSSLFNDTSLTNQYLSPLNFDRLSLEHQSRFRMIQAQLALNDGNYREALRILPQRIQGVPADLGQKILSTRMGAAQSSGDKLALVQELVLQESYLKKPHEISLNHDRIWNHAMQIPGLQLSQAISGINHPVLKNWLTLTQLARLSKNAPPSKKQNLRDDLANWLKSNPTHPGQSRAIALLSEKPITTVTPYAKVPNAVIQSTVVKQPAVFVPTTKTPGVDSLYKNIQKVIQ